jgi:hypothetical protein
MESANWRNSIDALSIVEDQKNEFSIQRSEVELHSEDKTSPLGKKALTTITCLLTLGLSKASSLAGRRIIINMLNSSVYSTDTCRVLAADFTKIHGKSSTKVKVSIKGTDVVLDGMAILGHPEKDPKDQMWIIKLLPMKGRYEPALDEAKRQAEEVGVNVLVFNYRGNAESEGQATKAQNYVDDSLAMIAYLKKEGVPAENIILHGHSFGGGVAAKAAAQKENSSIRIVSQQSFSSFDKATKAYINERTGETLGGMAAAAVRSLGFSFNTVKLYENDKHFADRTFIFHSGDEDKMVAEQASLATGLRRKNIDKIGEVMEIKKENVFELQKERYMNFIDENYEDKTIAKDVKSTIKECDDMEDMATISMTVFDDLFRPILKALNSKVESAYYDFFRKYPVDVVFDSLRSYILENDLGNNYQDVAAKLAELSQLFRVEEDPHLQPLSDFAGANKAMKNWLERKPTDGIEEESVSEREGMADKELVMNQRVLYATKSFSSSHL